MIVSDWSKYVPGDSIDDWIQFLNDFGWNITLESKDKFEYVYAGDHTLIKTERKNEQKTFLFGMAVALAVLPNEILDDIKKLIAE